LGSNRTVRAIVIDAGYTCFTYDEIHRLCSGVHDKPSLKKIYGVKKLFEGEVFI